MKVINYGKNYELYEDGLKTYDVLPAKTYKVFFSKMTGFYLYEVDDFEIKEEKVYGNHEPKLNKVFNSYDKFDRSLGVIMSGDKGIGKSLFTQQLAERAIKQKLPVVIVDRAYQGIASFLDSINQECLILIDEFEKVFDERDENTESQNALLSLFDGISQKKRMYVITVNNLNKVNQFMLNRPGRFHYHFRFKYPTAEEIVEYLQDKIDEEHYSEIDHVVKFAARVQLNYDSLRAIAFELSTGLKFSELIDDLNILNDETARYDVQITFKDKHLTPVHLRDISLDLFKQQCEISFCCSKDDNYYTLLFNVNDIEFDELSMSVDPSKVELNVDYDDNVLTKELIESIRFKQNQLDRLSFAF